MRNIGILLYNGVEDLDFCAPLEVFSVASKRYKKSSFYLFTVADRMSIKSSSGLSITPDFLISECPRSDILVVPGGAGSRQQIHNSQIIQWILEQTASSEIVFSVCTGAFLLAKAGILSGLRVTTHHQARRFLLEIEPSVISVEGVRFVDNGTVITAGGVSSGIDASLHIVSRLLGYEVASKVATFIEYEWPAKSPQELS